VHRDVSARRLRDPLQIPIGLGFDDDRAAPTVLQAAVDFAVWLAIVCGAAVGVYFVAASVPELKAATHHHASATPAAAAAASSEHRVSDQQRADAES
jgi:hypothetical protein